MPLICSSEENAGSSGICNPFRIEKETLAIFPKNLGIHCAPSVADFFAANLYPVTSVSHAASTT